MLSFDFGPTYSCDTFSSLILPGERYGRRRAERSEADDRSAARHETRKRASNGAEDEIKANASQDTRFSGHTRGRRRGRNVNLIRTNTFCHLGVKFVRNGKSQNIRASPYFRMYQGRLRAETTGSRGNKTNRGVQSVCEVGRLEIETGICASCGLGALVVKLYFIN
jgi:hypothetical protein